jgi:hypothetical protein
MIGGLNADALLANDIFLACMTSAGRNETVRRLLGYRGSWRRHRSRTARPRPVCVHVIAVVLLASLAISRTATACQVMK